MSLLSRSLPLPRFFIDANVVNARCQLPFMNLIEKWHRNGVIAVRMPQDAQLEAEAGHSRIRVLKARSYIAPLPLITTAQERAMLELIEGVLCGSKPMSPSTQRDALIVFTATKYHAILITADGGSKSQPKGILGSADELKRAVGTQIMSQGDAVRFIRREIAARDNFAHRFTVKRGLRLPDWVGAD